MKVLIVGGHMAPALAVIHALPKGTDIIYVGRKYTFEGDKSLSLEYRQITSLGLPFISLTTGRLQRKITRHTLFSLGKIPYGIFKAFVILQKEKPDCILGCGGYLSVPVGIAAFILKIPVVIHEQTFHAGLANKILARFATKICVGWEETASYFPKDKTIVTGNPILPSAPSKDASALIPKGNLPLLCIIGGSGGSHAINVLVENVLPQLLEKYRIIHQTGDASEYADFDRLQKLKNTLDKQVQEKYMIIKFIEPQNVEYLLDKANLIVSRSGINTVTTLLRLKKPSLLIPLPTGQLNEQQTNARKLEQLGLAKVVDQGTLSPQDFLQTIASMISTTLYSSDHEIKTLQVLHINSAERIVKVLFSCIKTQS